MSDSGNDGARPIPGREAPAKAKRFYKDVTTAARGSGFAVLLDGRPIRTPAKLVVVVPTQPLAEALADEWRAQSEHIDPATMPLTRHVNTVRDGIEGREQDIRDDLARFAGGDLICYRADSPEGLVAAQAAAWDELLDWAHRALNCGLKRGTGLMPITQPAEAISAYAAAIANRQAYELAGLHTMTSLSGSAILALAVADGILSPEQGWAAAHVDEDWQIAQWGEDAEAQARRRFRQADFLAAARLVALSRT